MELPEHLHCLFAASIEEQDGASVIDVPEHELDLGELEDGESYRIAIIASPSSSEPEPAERTTPEPDDGHEPSEPPVEEGETRNVEIEDIGDQGDGSVEILGELHVRPVV